MKFDKFKDELLNLFQLYNKQYILIIDDYTKSFDVKVYQEEEFIASFDIYDAFCKIQEKSGHYDLYNKDYTDFSNYYNDLVVEIKRLLGGMDSPLA